MAGEIVPVIGKVVAVSSAVEGDDTTFQYVTIEREDGSARHFAAVCALPELAGFLQQDAGGAYVFLNKPDGCVLPTATTARAGSILTPCAGI
jgi:hypothetical protein